MSTDSPEIQPNTIFRKILSPFRPHTKEIVADTETKIKAIIEHAEKSVDRARTKRGYTSEQPRIAGKRSGMCGLYTDTVTYLSRLDGLESHIFQVQSVHRSLLYNHLYNDPDQHVFSTVSGSDGKSFLIDLSVGQFLEKERLDQINNPLIQQLLLKGYVPLTDQTLQEYLLFTNPKMDPNSFKHLSQVKYSDLLNPNRKLERGYDRNDEDLKELI